MYANLLYGRTQPEAADRGKGAADGKNAGQEHGIVGSTVSEKMEEEGNEGSTGGLAHETGCCKHASRTAGTVVGRGTQKHVVVGRLEEPESGPAHHQPPCNVQMRGVLRNKCKQETAGTHQQQAETSQHSGMHPAYERAGQRGHEHDDQRPGSHQQSRKYAGA